MKSFIRVVFKSVLMTVLMTALGFSTTAQAQLVVEITQGLNDAVPIAIVPFGVPGPVVPTIDIAEVIQNDLARSGRFA